MLLSARCTDELSYMLLAAVRKKRFVFGFGLFLLQTLKLMTCLDRYVSLPVDSEEARKSAFASPPTNMISMHSSQGLCVCNATRRSRKRSANLFGQGWISFVYGQLGWFERAEAGHRVREVRRPWSISTLALILYYNVTIQRAVV